MPAGDGTGPLGRGAMTGRRVGYCAGYNAPGYANPMPGRGLALGWGRGGGGRGWRRQYYAGGPPAAYGPYTAPPTREQEIELLKTQAEWLKEQFDAISQRITELERKE